MKHVDLTEIDIKSSVLHLALPMMIGGLLQNLFSIVDLFFVGKLGHIALAGLSVSAMIVMIIIVGITGITTGTIALVSHFIGKKDYDNANIVLWQTIFLSLLLWVILLFVGIYGIEFLLTLFGAEGEVLKMATPYLKIIFMYSGIIFLYVTTNQSLSGSGDAKTPLKILVAANAVNIILDPLLIFGIGPFPRLEVAGSAVATVISYSIGLLISVVFLWKKKTGFRLCKKSLKINCNFIERICRIGFFASLQMLFTNISLLMLTRLVASFGPEALAAYGIGSKMKMLLIVPCFAFANSAAILMGQNMGAESIDRARQSTRISIIIFQLIILPVIIALFIFSPQIVGVFNSNPALIGTGASYIKFIMVSIPFLGTTLILTRGLSGVGDTAFPTILVAVFTLGVRIGGSYFFALNAVMGTDGIWLGINISDILLALFMVFYFKSGSWVQIYQKHRFLIEGKN